MRRLKIEFPQIPPVGVYSLCIHLLWRPIFRFGCSSAFNAFIPFVSLTRNVAPFKDTDWYENQKIVFFLLVFRGVCKQMATTVRVLFERQPLCSESLGYELWSSQSREVRTIYIVCSHTVLAIRPNPLTNPPDRRTVRIVQTH